nr:MAK10-like protein [Tanacetum cinerariifolium]
MGDENPIRTLGDYSKPSHEGYRNTIELLVGNKVVPLQSDTIQLVQNGCSFHGLRSEDPNQHLRDFLKLVDSIDLDGENRERTRLQNLYQKHGLVSRTYYKKSLIMASTFGSKSKFFMTMSIPSQDEPLTNRLVNEEEEKDSPKISMSTLPYLPISSVAFITEKVLNFNSFFESLMLVPQSSDIEVICTKGDDEEVMFIELIRKNDESRKENLKRKGVQQPKG